MSVCRAARWAKELGQSTLRANGTRRAQMGRVARAIETRRARKWDALRAQLGRVAHAMCVCVCVRASVYVCVIVGLCVCVRVYK